MSHDFQVRDSLTTPLRSERLYSHQKMYENLSALSLLRYHTALFLVVDPSLLHCMYKYIYICGKQPKIRAKEILLPSPQAKHGEWDELKEYTFHTPDFKALQLYVDFYLSHDSTYHTPPV